MNQGEKGKDIKGQLKSRRKRKGGRAEGRKERKRVRKETRGKEWKGTEIVQESCRMRGISERKGGEIKKEDGGGKNKKGKGGE